MGKSCPSIVKSQVQSVFAALEDVSGVQQPPAPADYILPSGRASMTQTPGFSDSEELSRSLNSTAQFQDAVPAGWREGDLIYPWTPVGTALVSRHANVLVDGVAGKMNDGTLTYQSPLTNLNEIGDEFPGEGIDGKRTMLGMFSARNARRKIEKSSASCTWIAMEKRL